MFLYITSPEEFGREPNRLTVLRKLQIHLHVVALRKGYPSGYSYRQHRKPGIFSQTLQLQSSENKAYRKTIQSNQYSLFNGQMFSKPQGKGYTFLVGSISRWFIQQFEYFIGLYQYFH